MVPRRFDERMYCICVVADGAEALVAGFEKGVSVVEVGIRVLWLQGGAGVVACGGGVRWLVQVFIEARVKVSQELARSDLRRSAEMAVDAPEY